MSALMYDVVVEQGADFRLALRWIGPDGGPVDLTGFTALSQMRISYDSEDVLLEFSSDPAASSDTRILLGGAIGTVVLEADAPATQDLSFRQGVYDVKVTSEDGAVYRLAKGRVMLSRTVTA